MKQKLFTLTTPVLFLTFNRLDSTKKVFEEIKKVQPKQLFIAADGPRTKEEKKKTDAVRNYVLDNIDWDCNVKKLFRKKNLGCKYAVSGAIDWFFKNVEQGIILEDDCLPLQSFFRFCQEMLEKYKEDKKIMSVSGYNPVGKIKKIESYFFSKYFFCWGWGSWKRDWKRNNLEMENYSIKDKRLNLGERILFLRKFKDILSGRISSWAASFSYSHFEKRGLSIIPKNNLIKNLGFSNSNSTNTKENKWDKKFLNRNSHELKFPLTHPKQIKQNKGFDRKYLLQEYKRIILKKLF